MVRVWLYIVLVPSATLKQVPFRDARALGMAHSTSYRLMVYAHILKYTLLIQKAEVEAEVGNAKI